MTWTLTDIISKTRKVTGTPSTDQLSDADVTAYINQYYLYVMPFELKEQITQQYLKFTTVPGIDVYSFPGGFFTDQPGAYADGFPCIFYQDTDIFFQDWPQQYAVDNLSAGDGVTTTFTGGLQNPPVVAGTLLIASNDVNDVTYVAQDSFTDASFPNGTLSGTGISSGTINYLTGAFSITYITAPSATATIYAKYQGYQGNRPQGILFFNNQFTLRPVPDQVYQILMQGYIMPQALSVDTQTALQAEWGALIAYGASLEIFSDRGDMENYTRYFPQFKRYENVALGRTVTQLTPQQGVPRF